ncbi:MAG: metal-sulfur cluster assembly factor [Sulfuritalea sp.]|nr:metal-sulfur cluster assembly factor [Sulfuritalea sp.]
MTTAAAASAAPDKPSLDEQQVRDVLRQVIDPEVGMNIVALGLVYRVEVAPDSLVIEMTMTSPACPMGEMIVGDVHAALKQILPDTIEPDIRLVWEPPWNPSMMDEASKQHFGWEPE